MIRVERKVSFPKQESPGTFQRAFYEGSLALVEFTNRKSTRIREVVWGNGSARLSPEVPFLCSSLAQVDHLVFLVAGQSLLVFDLREFCWREPIMRTRNASKIIHDPRGYLIMGDGLKKSSDVVLAADPTVLVNQVSCHTPDVVSKSEIPIWFFADGTALLVDPKSGRVDSAPKIQEFTPLYDPRIGWVGAHPIKKWPSKNTLFTFDGMAHPVGGYLSKAQGHFVAALQDERVLLRNLRNVVLASNNGTLISSAPVSDYTALLGLVSDAVLVGMRLPKMSTSRPRKIDLFHCDALPPGDLSIGGARVT